MGKPAVGFTPIHQRPSLSGSIARLSNEEEPKPEDPREDPITDNIEDEDETLDRFLSPKIDDPGLPLTDALVAQVVAPSLQIFFLASIRAPSPTWLRPIFENTLWQARGSLLAPALIHGAGLACCWIAGALASQAYENKAIDPTVEGWGTVVGTVVKAGAFASGVLILSTQLDLLLEFGRWIQLGESQETDRRIITAFFEVASDIFFEATAISSLRFYLAWSTAKGKGRNP